MTQSPREFLLHKLRSIQVEIVLVYGNNAYDRIPHFRKTPMARLG